MHPYKMTGHARAGLFLILHSREHEPLLQVPDAAAAKEVRSGRVSSEVLAHACLYAIRKHCCCATPPGRKVCTLRFHSREHDFHLSPLTMRPGASFIIPTQSSHPFALNTSSRKALGGSCADFVERTACIDRQT